MSCSDGQRKRRALLAGGGALLLLGGCGLRPLYGGGGGNDALAGRVAVEAPPGREGYYYQRALRRRFGEAGTDAPWRLTTALSFERRDVAITTEADVTRFDIIGAARYRLIPRGRAAPAREGVVEATSAYNTLAAPYATATAERDALRRISEALAQRVFIAVAATLPETPAEDPDPA